jgi:Tfp pilus assembly protein PilV
MTYSSLKSSLRRGSSLIEAVLAIGVMAVAVPLVFAALAESGKSAMASEAETRSSWIIPICMDEIRASREGIPQFFTATTVNQAFPASGDVWAIAFSPEGSALGKVTKTDYDKGTKTLNGKTIRYLATLSAEAIALTQDESNAKPGIAPMMRARITLEYPAASPVARRQKMDFFTRIP